MPRVHLSTYRAEQPGNPYPMGRKVLPVNGLRSAITLQKTLPNQYVEADREVDPKAASVGVSRPIGVDGTVVRPKRLGSATTFNAAQGDPERRVLAGLLANRTRAGASPGAPEHELGAQIPQTRVSATPLVVVDSASARSQEAVHRADDKDSALCKLLLAPTNTSEDAGPYRCMGLDPIYVGAAPIPPAGCDGPCWAGGLRGRPIERGDHLTLLQPAIAQAEIVVEGNIPPNVRIAEAHNIKTGKAMAVIPTYLVLVNPLLPTIEIEAVTSQTNPRLRGAVLFGETPR